MKTPISSPPDSMATPTAVDRPRRGGRVLIYPGRLRRNARAPRQTYGPSTIEVIKGDGYGLGVVRCAAVLASAGTHALAVGSLSEAIQVRAAGITTRLIVLDPDGITVPAADRSGAEWLVGQTEIDRLLTRRAVGEPLRVHLDIDFGTGRGGVPVGNAPETLTALLAARTISVAGLAGQLPANPPETTVHQALTTLAGLRRRCPGAMVHIGGSDVLRWHRPTPAAWARLGRPLYGIPPRDLDRVPPTGVAPVWAWQAGATAYQPAGSVGYHGAQPPSGTPVRIDVGYADGLPPQAAGRWPILIDSRPYVIHQVFMLASIAYPTGEGLAPGESGTALLSGQNDNQYVPARQVSEALNVASTTVLMCPRSPREVARQ